MTKMESCCSTREKRNNKTGGRNDLLPPILMEGDHCYV